MPRSSTAGLTRQPHALGTAWRTQDGDAFFLHLRCDLPHSVKAGDWMPMVRFGEGQGHSSLPEPGDLNPIPTTTATFRTLREARAYVEAFER